MASAAASDTINPASFASIIASISSNAGRTQTTPRSSQATTNSRTNSPSTTSATQTTLSTSTRTSTDSSSITSSASLTSTATSQIPNSSSNFGTSSTTGQAAASSSASSSTAAQSQSQSCHSVSCSPGLQAAIAVPIVVVVLALLALLFFCIRRRKRRAAETEDEKIARRKKKWSKQFGPLPFENENKKGQEVAGAGTKASIPSSAEGTSMHRDPEKNVSPAARGRFREDIPSAAAANSVSESPSNGNNLPKTSPSSGPSGPITTTTTTSTVMRPTGATTTTSGPTTTITDTGRDPFRESTADRGMSRQSERNDDALSYMGSDAGSIHDVQLGRSASVLSTGRILNVRRST